MLLSIILPFHRIDKLLFRAIDSIIPQLHGQSELILIGDGLSDKDCSEIEQYDTLPNLKIFALESLGANKARQHGVAQSSGEYITFCDSDDIFTSNALTTFIEIIEKHHPDLIIANRRRVERDHTTSTYNYARPEVLLLKKDLTAKEIQKFPPSVYAKAVKRTFIQGFDFDPSSIHQDLNITAKVFKNADRFFFTNRIVYHYIKREHSISSKEMKDYTVLMNSTLAIDGFIEYYHRFDLSKTEKRYLAYTVFNYYVRLIINARSIGKKELIAVLRYRFKKHITLPFLMELMLPYPKAFLLSIIIDNNLLFAIYSYYLLIRTNNAL